MQAKHQEAHERLQRRSDCAQSCEAKRRADADALERRLPDIRDEYENYQRAQDVFERLIVAVRNDELTPMTPTGTSYPTSIWEEDPRLKICVENSYATFPRRRGGFPPRMFVRFDEADFLNWAHRQREGRHATPPRDGVEGATYWLNGFYVFLADKEKPNGQQGLVSLVLTRLKVSNREAQRLIKKLRPTASAKAGRPTINAHTYHDLVREFNDENEK